MNICPEFPLWRSLILLFDAHAGNYSEFRRAVNIISTDLPDFNLDANVSVFETTIRVLGGLLSAHLMAIDPKLNIYVSGSLFSHVDEVSSNTV